MVDDVSGLCSGFSFFFSFRVSFSLVFTSHFSPRAHTQTRTGTHAQPEDSKQEESARPQRATVKSQLWPFRQDLGKVNIIYIHTYIYGRHEGPEPEQAGRLAVSCQPARAPSKAKLGSAIETRSKCCRTRQSSNQIAKMCV